MDADAIQFFSEIAVARARSEPKVLQRAISRSCFARWASMSPITAQDVLAAALVDDGVALLDCADSHGPTSVELWLDVEV